MDNAILHASVNSPAEKIEEQINFALSHACLILPESDYEQDDKSSAANTFDISFGGGGYRASFSAITVSVLDTSDVVRCLIFASALFLPNYPLPSDNMVD